MEQPKITVQKTATYYGVMTGLAAIIYMVLLKVFGLIESVSLHFLMGFILVVGVVLALKNHSAKKNGQINYLEGLGVGALVGLVTAVVFAIFQLVVNMFFDSPFTYPYLANDSYGDGGALGFLIITWIVLGLVIGAFIGYLSMQYFKGPSHSMKED